MFGNQKGNTSFGAFLFFVVFTGIAIIVVTEKSNDHNYSARVRAAGYSEAHYKQVYTDVKGTPIVQGNGITGMIGLYVVDSSGDTVRPCFDTLIFVKTSDSGMSIRLYIANDSAGRQVNVGVVETPEKFYNLHK